MDNNNACVFINEGLCNYIEVAVIYIHIEVAVIIKYDST